MPLGIDHFSHSGAADDGNPSWSHAGGASPKGVLVFVIVGDDTTPRISGVTYGGLALTEVSGSPQVRSGGGRDLMVSAYFLGSNVPAGTQTVAVTGSSPDFKHAACFTLTADGDTAVVATGNNTGDTGQDPSATLNLGGETCFCALAGIFDTLDVDDVSPLANWTARSEQDVPTDEDEPAAGVVYSYDIIGSQNVTAGVTAASVIHAMIAVAVRDTDPGEPADTPSITEVDGDNTITSDQTGVEITGTNFDNATVEIRQGALAIEQTVTSQSSTSISIDVVFEIEDQPSLRFGTAELAVINTDEQEDTIEITIVPPSGELYVDVVSPVQDPDQALTADPPAATGDQVHVFGSAGGAAPAGLSINPDLTFEFAPESEPEAFAFRFWDASDATWGDWATRAIGGAVEGSVTEASAFGATFAPAATQRVTFTAGIQAASALSGQASTVGLMSSAIEAGEAFSGRAVALGAIVEALEAGDTDAAAQAAVAALSAQVETDAQYAAIAQAAAAIQAGLAAGEAWAALAAAEAGITAGHELGATFSGDTQAAQEAALAAGTEAAALFLGAVAAFALLQAGATASDAFAASSLVSQAFTGAAQLGASFTPITGDTSQISAAAAIQAAFVGAVAASGQLAMAVDVDDAFEAVSVALSAISAGVILGATFAASSTADISIIGAVASVRAIRMKATIN